MNGASSLLDSIIQGGIDKWREGLIPFMTSPYGIAIAFLVLFLFLNSMRMRL
jgi:hypothetical protein